MRHLTLAIAAAAALAPLAGADVTNSSWSGTSTFNFRVIHMPDLDQRRSSLPGNGGMYCVPTSTINLFCYAANHGFPGTPPGPGNWQSQSKYSDASSAIATLGVLMGTSAADGTGGSGTSTGLNLWASQSGLLSTVRRSKTSNYTPTVAKMAHLACQGWIMSFAYGRYDVVGTVSGVPVVSRTGGHAVTMIRATRNGSSYVLKYRDPADDASLSSQSTFAYKTVYPAAVSAFFGVPDLRTMNAIGYPSSDGKIRFVDSYWGIRPIYGIRFTNGSNLMGGGGGSIQLIDPTPLEGSINLMQPSIPISTFTSVEDLAMHPDMTDLLLVTRSIFVGQPSQLRKLDLIDGTLTTLTDAPTDLVKIRSSREGFIYAFDPLGKVYRLATEGAIDTATSATPLPSDIDFDDVSDRLALLSISTRRIAKYSKTLSVIENYVVPTNVPMSGDGSVRVDPTTGLSWFKTDASTLLYNVTLSQTGAPVVATITPTTIAGGLRSFHFGDNGELYLQGDGSVKVMKKTGPGTWVADPTSPFDGQPGGQFMVLSRSTTNDDPAIHDTLAWKNIDAQNLLPIGEVHPDCDADLNGDDIVDGADIGILLGKWGTVRGIADLNQDGIVNGADLGLLLGAWGNCL